MKVKDSRLLPLIQEDFDTPGDWFGIATGGDNEVLHIDGKNFQVFEKVYLIDDVGGIQEIFIFFSIQKDRWLEMSRFGGLYFSIQDQIDRVAISGYFELSRHARLIDGDIVISSLCGIGSAKVNDESLLVR